MRRDFISAIHKSVREALRTRQGATIEPQDAKEGLSKEYPRMPRIVLPQPAFPAISLEDALQKRTSSAPEQQSESRALPLATLSPLLAAAGMNTRGHRTYPSGGNLFPIEMYLVGRVAERNTRVYHYVPKQHALEDLWELPEQFTLFDIFGTYLDNRYASRLRGAIIFTSVWERNAPKYGDFAYDLSLLEAGHIAQNILLTASTLGIGARPMGGFIDAALCEMLDIDNDGEQVVYAVALY